MTSTVDTIVVGLGAMGSAAAYHLARRGHRVVGIDRFAPPHDQGSSHGLTRIIREAYYEQPLYVPLVRRAFELWRDLEHAAGLQEGALLVRNGGLTLGPPEGELVRGVLLSARTYNVPHEVLSADEVRRRFPHYTIRSDWTAVFEPGAGFVRPESIISAHLDLARRHGATLLVDEPVTGWSAGDYGVRVETSRSSFEADRLVICAGAWAGQLVSDVSLPVVVERQVSHWFSAAGGAQFDPTSMPVSMWELDHGQIFYSTPDVGRGVKVGFHYGGEVSAPDEVRRSVTTDEQDRALTTFRELVPAAAGAVSASAICLYTNTPDKDFLIDTHPSSSHALMVSACSGHGFKFSAAIGELVADWVEGHPPRVDIAPFALSRFAPA